MGRSSDLCDWRDITSGCVLLPDAHGWAGCQWIRQWYFITNQRHCTIDAIDTDNTQE